MLNENILVSPVKKTLLYPSPKIGVNLSIEKDSYTEKNVNKMLIIVNGTISEMVFAIARRPIKFDIRSAKIKNIKTKIIGER